jgi:nicotinamidase-related amidase
MTSRTALLVIDVQNGLTSGPDRVYDSEGLVERIRALTERARQAGAPVFYIQDNDVGPIGSTTWQLHPGLGARPDDPTIRKPYGDSFYKTELQELLGARGIQRLVIAGCKTDACVDVTCRRAISLGYHVTLAADGHSTTDNRFLAAPQSIEYYNLVLDGLGLEDGFGAGERELAVQPCAAIEFEAS